MGSGPFVLANDALRLAGKLHQKAEVIAVERVRNGFALVGPDGGYYVRSLEPRDVSQAEFVSLERLPKRLQRAGRGDRQRSAASTIYHQRLVLQVIDDGDERGSGIRLLEKRPRAHLMHRATVEKYLCPKQRSGKQRRSGFRD